MCPECQAEYEDPADRRFHAQPTCCQNCGPTLRLLDEEGRQITSDDPLAAFARGIRAGRIGAMKGMGGFHLICDATSEAAVAELRRGSTATRSHLPSCCRSCRMYPEICTVSALERQLLESPRAPIVLVRKREGCLIANAVAPGNPPGASCCPYTPLHHLLLRRWRRDSAGDDQRQPLGRADRLRG